MKTHFKYSKGLSAMSIMPLPAKMKGLSLIELMIAMTISSVLLLGVSSIYLNSRETDKFTSELSRIQETGRQAVEFLAQSFRMAGYTGCLDPTEPGIPINYVAIDPPTENVGESTLRGFEVDDNNWAVGTEFDGAAIEAAALEGSDVIAVQQARTLNSQIVVDMADESSDIVLSNNAMLLRVGEVVVIADCETADMFRISSVVTNAGDDSAALEHDITTNDANTLQKAYLASSSKLMRYSAAAYYVGATGRFTAKGNPINALFRTTDPAQSRANPAFVTEELIEGVDNMQVLYGEKVADTNIRYVTADNVTDMSQVNSLKIGLLISGTRDVLERDDDAAYNLPGETIEPIGTPGANTTHDGDRRLRKDFTITINLRNRR